MKNWTGINLAFVKLLACKGANVIVGDIQGSAAFKEFEKEPRTTKLLFQKTDVSNWRELEALFTRAKTELGPIDLVCNGAGVFEPVRFWFSSKLEDFRGITVC